MDRKKVQFPDRLDIMVIVIWIVIAIIAAFNDLQISEHFVNYNSFLGQFTANYGTIPGYFLILVSLILLPHNIAREKWVNEGFDKDNIMAMAIVLLWLVPSFIIAYQLTESFILRIVLTLVIPIPPVVIYRRYEDQISPHVIKAAKQVLLVAVIVPAGIVGITKTLWGRVRYRDLNASHSNFTPWYLPQGITGNFSFPSGHSAMAWLTLASIFYFRNPKKRLTVIIITAIWALTVCIGRVVIGAHYLSDVTFSAAIAILVINYFVKKNRIEESA